MYGAGAPDEVMAQPAGQAAPRTRFASLKADRVHLRQGPGFEHKVLWVYQRAGLPVEVLREFEGWAQVRDSEGGTGWVLHSLVSGRRTALVVPWEVKDGQPLAAQVPLRKGERGEAAVIALVEPGVIANIIACDRTWCRVAIGDYRGYIEQKKLWGVYPDEAL